MRRTLLRHDFRREHREGASVPGLNQGGIPVKEPRPTRKRVDLKAASPRTSTERAVDGQCKALGFSRSGVYA